VETIGADQGLAMGRCGLQAEQGTADQVRAKAKEASVGERRVHGERISP